MKDLISREVVERKIHLIRGHNVMLDKDLASLYLGVSPKISCFSYLKKKT